MIRDYSKYEMSNRENLLFFSSGYCLMAGIAFLFYHSFLLSILCGLVIILLRPFYEKYQVQRRRQKLTLQFKDMLYSLSSSIAAGRHMSEALCEAHDNLSNMYEKTEPIMLELAHMKKSIKENNESDKVLLEDFAKRASHEDISNFVQVYITCRSTGGDTESIIGKASTVLTDKMNIEREIRAITAQKKLEGRLISVMPAGMLLVLNLLSPAYISPLYTTVIGRLIMTAALLLTAYGIWLMERISRVEI